MPGRQCSDSTGAASGRGARCGARSSRFSGGRRNTEAPHARPRPDSDARGARASHFSFRSDAFWALAPKSRDKRAPRPAPEATAIGTPAASVRGMTFIHPRWWCCTVLALGACSAPDGWKNLGSGATDAGYECEPGTFYGECGCPNGGIVSDSCDAFGHRTGCRCPAPPADVCVRGEDLGPCACDGGPGRVRCYGSYTACRCGPPPVVCTPGAYTGPCRCDDAGEGGTFCTDGGTGTTCRC